MYEKNPRNNSPINPNNLSTKIVKAFLTLFTVDNFGTRNGSIRITKAEHVKIGAMSRRVGSMMDDCTNIHSEQDLLNAEKNINERIH